MYNLKDWIGYTVRATDGDIGTVHDFYIDDFDWIIRYMVVDTGDEGDGRMVLLAPVVFGMPDFENEVFPVSINREMVKGSPDITADPPVSRQDEMVLHDYYQWPYYWNAGGIMAYPLADLQTQMEDNEAQRQPEGNPHLRSAKKVIGYGIQARDGDLGKLDNIIIDESSWKIMYLIVETGIWFFGRKVLVSPQWVKQIRWTDSQIEVDLNRDTIQKSPAYNPDTPIDREYETQLYEYYGQKKYWE